MRKNFISEHFQNRDLSWLDFNFRVLNEALDSRTPLLERLRFIDIFRSNNDEFFMKRIGSLLQKIESPTSHMFIDGNSPQDLYLKTREKVEKQLIALDESFCTDILPSLQDEGIQFLQWSDLSSGEKKKLRKYFTEHIFPILTPLAVDLGHPFPFLSNLSKSIALCIRKPRGKNKHFARVKIPSDLPQWIPVASNESFSYRFINIEEIITNNVHELFHGMLIESWMIFRITRNAAISGDDEEIDDLIELVEDGLKERKFAPIVRLEYQYDADPWLIDFLTKELEISMDKFYPIYSMLSYTSFSKVVSIGLPHLRNRPFTGKVQKVFGKKDIFKQISKKDILLHFPYDSFRGSIESFLQAAVNDPAVKAIKMTLYRTDEDGRLIKLLIEAAEKKKQVACLVELKARFDEERNIKWAQALDEAGIHVSYGLAKYKIHAKMILVIREENKKLKPYLNIGTGNYNSQTSSLYTDLSLFTCEKDICADAQYVFNYLTGRSLKGKYKELLVAPFNMHQKFIALIQAEIRHAVNGKSAEIIAKMNSMEDPEVIEQLYKASKAGVKITLIVRGFCTLRAGVKGLSENIRVFSLVGRLLEHSRIYYFRNAEKDFYDGQFYIGSADWMHRNLFDRIEVISPIYDKSLRKKIWKILQITLADNRHLWEMNSDGKYIQKSSAAHGEEINCQKKLINGIDDAANIDTTLASRS